MPTGYLVTLGDGILDAGDAISGSQSTFTTSSSIGAGNWIWSGTYGNNTYNNIQDSGVYYEATDGNVYFVPDNYFITSGTAQADGPPTYPVLSSDGTIDGTSGDDDIDFNYNDTGSSDKVDAGDSSGTDEDIIVAGAGNDTVDAGDANDTVYGGTGADTLSGGRGNDSIDGGTGNDVIYGDADGSNGGNIETAFRWDEQGVADETSITGGLTGNSISGDIQVAVSVTQEENFTGASMETNDSLYDYDERSDSSSIELYGGGSGTGQNASTVTFDFSANDPASFSDEVTDVTFGIHDIDELQNQFIDQVIITAFDALGNPVPVVLTAGDPTTITVDNSTGTATSIVNSGGSGLTSAQTGFIQVSIAGPVAQIVVDYNNVDSAYGNHAIRIGDVEFSQIPVAEFSDADDVISGGDGADVVYGGEGNDTIQGNADGDTIYGGTGDDTLSGDAGIDTLYGGEGADSIDGGTGNDSVSGGDGNDTVDLGTGNDTFGDGTTEAGNDTVYGGTGNDFLNGGADDDELYGGANDDTLIGASGDDTLYGGDGSDQFLISDEHDADTIIGGEDLGDGDIDTVSFSDDATTAGVTITATGDEAGTYAFNGTSASGSFIEIEDIDGTENDDIIDMSADTSGMDIDGGAGADALTGGSGDDTINLGEDSPGVSDGDEDVVTLVDGFGNDILTNFDAPTPNGDGTFTGIDTVDVSGLYDLPLGDPDRTPVLTNDVVVSDDGSGNALLTFPNGETITLVGIDPTDADDPFYLNAIGIPMPDGTVEGTSGADTIDASYTGDPDGDMVDAGDAILAGDTNNDDLIYGYGGNDSITAGAGDDEIYGGTGSDTIDGGTGDDTITAGTGNDTIVLNETSGTNAIDGGEDGNLADIDTLDFSSTSVDRVIVQVTGDEAGTYDVDNGAADGTFTNIEAIVGTDGGDFIDSALNTSDITVSGGDGDDFIAGGSGDDVLNGDAGDDTIELNDSFGDDTITGGETGETNGDSLFAGNVTDDLIVDLQTLNPADPESGTISDGTSTATFSEIENIYLGSGDDSVTGSSGDDNIALGEGADTINASAGDDNIDLGVGTDTPDGDADVVVLEDGFGNDTVEGFDAPTPNGDGTFTGIDTLDVSGLYDLPLGDPDRTPVLTNDVVVSDDGSGNALLTFPNGETITLVGIDPTDADDPFYLNAIGIPMPDGTVEGTSGADTIDASYTGDPDGDMVDAGDAILAGDANDDDLIYGYGGNDSITAGQGYDEVYGGSGADTIDGGDQGDLIYGGAGNDTIEAGEEANIGDDDIIYGGTGNDTITSAEAADTSNDTLYGEDGNDTITVTGGSNNLLDGGADDDTLTGGTGSDTMLGGTGDDSLNVASGGDVDVIEGGEDVGNGDVDTLTFSDGSGTEGVDVTMSGDEAGSYAFPTDGGSGTFSEIEQFNLTDLDDTFDGVAVTGGSTVDGGAGNDTITGGAGADSFIGGAGSDEIYGGDGNDAIDGGDDADTIDGGAGDDTLTGGDGADTITGGADQDVIYGGAGDVIDGSETGTDNDTLIVSGVDYIDYDTNPENGIVYFEGGGSLTFSNIENVVVSDRDGTVSGTAGDDTIDASYVGDPDGDQVDDTDAILAGHEANDDLIEAGAGNDTIIAGNGDDSIYGEAGDDLIFGGVGGDTAFGGTGDDIINGGDEADTLYGGDDADTFVQEAGFGSDVIEGGEGGTDNDEIRSTQNIDVNVTATGDEAGSITDGTSTATFSEIEAIETEGGDDTINLAADSAGMTVDAGAGNDVITGGSGDDSLVGGDGADALTGGAGNDTMSGGEGNDAFVLGEGFGVDTITGGEDDPFVDVDTLDAGGMTSDVVLDFTADEAGTLTEGANVATFSEVELFNLGSGDDSVIGGAGDDLVYAGAGADTMSGGEGADTFYGGAGEDDITFSEGDNMSGGSGDDEFTLVDLNETSNGTITIDGGSGDETAGDTLKLGTLGILTQDVIDTFVDDGTGSYSGSVTLDDGTILNFSEIENIICFTPGTRIATPRGLVAVEDLKIGDLVVTRDHGLQPIRWSESRTVPAVDRFAPVRISKNVLAGQDRDLIVSPQHRVLFQGYRAELLFGESEVLVSAKHLVDGVDVVQKDTGMVTYVHIMFDQHEIIYAEGAATESFHPGDIGFSAVSDQAREELFAIFPELRAEPSFYGSTARRSLKAHEARLIHL
ncbi:Hint domain-containing protein [Octadecabacter sp. CECT 8868]|uniref:Hint domain-containing protein n=1 Tax=Octadecabacter algicola TaxID=2909342 RepID=UPI001F2CEE62|nr:Hint domain-containing protein [Octadecabacter algicola]MCF2904314.1 Hint domain-containing protein [Octadecabacter algicola]